MWPNTDNFQILIEKPLNDAFRKIKYSRSQLEDYLEKKYKVHNENTPTIAFPVIEIDFIYKDGKHVLNYLDKFNAKKFLGFKRDRTKHLLIVLKETLEWIYDHNLEIFLPRHDFKIYFDVSDSFLEDSEGYPIFVHSRPSNNILPLYPDYTFFRMSFGVENCLLNWDQSKEIFKKYRSNKPPIKKKIFFRGVDSTSNSFGGDNSNIRNKLKELSISDPKTEIRVFPESEIRKRTVALYEDCGFETYLDLPGNFPWSFRKKFLYLTGGDVIQVQSMWEGKDLGPWTPWIQFIDQVLIPYPTSSLEFVYSIGEDNTEKIISLYEKIKEIPRLKETVIQRRLQKIEMLNMSRLYQYMTKMLISVSRYE